MSDPQPAGGTPEDPGAGTGRRPAPAGILPLADAAEAWPRTALVLLGMPIVAAAFSVLRYTPEVWFWRGIPIQWIGAARVPAIVAQFRDPWTWSQTAAASADAALQWRLLPPLVGHHLHLTTQQYLGLPWLGALWLLFLTGWYTWKLSGNRERAIVAVGFMAISAPWFMATICLGQNDVFFLIALLAFGLSPSVLVAGIACLLGPWIDERFLLALPLTAALRASAGHQRWWQPVLGILPYCLVRGAVTMGGDPSVSRQIALQLPAFTGYAPYLPVGWWYAFRLAWIPILAAVVICWRQAAVPQRLAMLVGLGGLGAIAFLAWDSTRSIAVLVAFLVFGVARMPCSRQWLWGMLLVTFLLPAAFVSAIVTPTAVQNVVIPITSFLFRP